jgi:hypothetical protein
LRAAARSDARTCSQKAAWPRPSGFRLRRDVGRRIDIKAVPLANRVGPEQAFNIGKAGEIAQNVMPSPGSEVSSVTSASRSHNHLRFFDISRSLVPKSFSNSCGW